MKIKAWKKKLANIKNVRVWQQLLKNLRILLKLRKQNIWIAPQLGKKFKKLRESMMLVNMVKDHH